MIASLVVLVLTGCASAASPSAALLPWEGGSREGLRIWAERAIEDVGDDEVVIYANGVTVWDNRTLFRLDRSRVEQILGAFREMRFETIPEASPRGKRLRSRAGIRTTSYSREAFQTWEAPENEALKRLVDRIFEVVGDPSQHQTSTAASLSEGLRKVARGELPVEAFRLVFHLRPGRGEEGVLFRVEHGVATAMPYIEGQFGAPVEIDISDQAIRDLARRLSEFDPETFPVNLYAVDYTEVSIEVLGRDKKVLARQFAGMTRQQHGEDQSRFEQMVALIRQIQNKWF